MAKRAKLTIPAAITAIAVGVLLIGSRIAGQGLQPALDTPDTSVIGRFGRHYVPFPFVQIDGTQRVLGLPRVRDPNDFFRGAEQWSRDVLGLLQAYTLFALDSAGDNAVSEMIRVMDAERNARPLAAEEAMVQAGRILAEFGRLEAARDLLKRVGPRLDRLAQQYPDEARNPGLLRQKGLAAFYLSRAERDIGNRAGEIEALEQAMDGARDLALKPLLSLYLETNSPKAEQIRSLWMDSAPKEATFWLGQFYFGQGRCKEALQQLGYSRNLPGSSNASLADYANWMSALCAWNNGDASRVPEFAGRFAAQPKGLSLLEGQRATAQARSEMDIGVTAHLQLAPGDNEIARQVFNGVLRFKGAMLEKVISASWSTRLRAAALEEESSIMPALRRDLFRRRSVRAMRGLSRDGGTELRTDIYRNDALWRLMMSGPAVNTGAISSEKIASMMPTDAALVEYVAYRKYLPGAVPGFGPVRYAVYVLRSDGSVQGRDLGPAEAIDKAVQQLVAAAEKREDSAESGAATLGKLIWTPVEPLIGASREVFIAPDGNLHLAPFPMLPGQAGRALFEVRRISLLDSGRDLQSILRGRQTGRAQPESPPVLVGDPAFDDGEAGTGLLAKPAEDTPFDPLPELPNTGVEVDAIGEILKAPAGNVWKKKQATETNLMALRSPAVLHLATHGEFLAKRLEGISSAEEPLLRGFVALTGANRLQAGTDDGVMTGLEASALQLQGTKMVVLSACRTGVGAVNPGEGVYGLRWGFAAAGAQSLVMTLWKVDDEASVALMKSFYRQLAAKKSKVEALSLAQSEIRANPKWRHPGYWAAFTVFGDPGPVWPLMAPAKGR